MLDGRRQREWRIGRGLTKAGTVHSRPLRDEEKQSLVTIDERFWSEMMGTPPNRRVDAAHVIDQFNNAPAINAISRIIVPPESLHHARELFGTKVVSIASIA